MIVVVVAAALLAPAAAVVVAASLLAPAAAVGIAARQSSACPATGQCPALGWGVSVAPSNAGYPSAASGGAAPTAPTVASIKLSTL